jgi:hypothetical protein
MKYNMQNKKFYIHLNERRIELIGKKLAGTTIEKTQNKDTA